MTGKCSTDKLRKLYVNDGWSIRDIADSLKSSPSTIYRRLKQEGVPIRSKSESLKLLYKDKPHHRGGVQSTEETKQSISDSLREHWGSDKAKKSRKKLSDAAKKKWHSLSEKEKVDKMQKITRAKRGRISHFAQSILDFDSDFYVEFSASNKKTYSIILGEGKVAIILVGMGISDSKKKLRANLVRRGFETIYVKNSSNSTSTSQVSTMVSLIKSGSYKDNILEL